MTKCQKTNWSADRNKVRVKLFANRDAETAVGQVVLLRNDGEDDDALLARATVEVHAKAAA